MIKYLNGYKKVNLNECHYPCARMVQILRVYCDFTRLLNFGRPSILQCTYALVETESFPSCVINLVQYKFNLQLRYHVHTLPESIPEQQVRKMTIFILQNVFMMHLQMFSIH